MNKHLPVRKIKSKYYEKVIEVRVPVRFYWTKDNTEGYDGLEFGPFPKGLSSWSKKLIYEILTTLGEIQQMAFPDKEIEIPKPFRKAFEEDE